MKPPLDKLDTVLQGQIKNPSPEFEKALRQIAEEKSERWSPFVIFSMVKVLAIAALLTLGFSLILQLKLMTPIGNLEKTVVTSELATTESLPEEAWLDMLTLASSLESAEVLTNNEIRIALEYYAYNP